MSLITRCPACQTSFRVVPDQLRISDGWVRCGQCQEVFDANAALVDASLATAPAHEPVGGQSYATTDIHEVSVSQATQELPQMPTESVAPSPEIGAVDVSLEPALGVLAGGDQPSQDGEVQGRTQPDAKLLAPHEALADAARQDVSFMRRMPEQSSWQRTSLRWVLIVSALALMSALVLQGIAYERNRIAAMFPQSRAGLIWACEILNCSISDFRQIDSVVIDSSSLNKVGGDAYRLALAIRNTSMLDLEMPSVELTLTDSQDQPVMRRVLMANELSATGSLAAASEWSGSIAISVRGNAAADRFSGYRVLAFYP